MKLAVGFFDGVHAGHRRILSSADAALTFRNHPATVLAPERVPPLLMTEEDRLAAIDSALTSAAAGRVRGLEFTRTLADESPAAFVDWLRATYPTCDTIVCGPNWRFGARGAGTADFLRAHGYTVEVPDFAEWKGEPVSSTRIRAALAAGELAEVTAMLGRAWSVTGRIECGKGLGRKIGFPTLNLHLPEELVSPPYGVYVLKTPLGRALANWGLAPTLGDQAWQHPVLEVHLLTFQNQAHLPPPTSPVKSHSTSTELMYQIHQFGGAHGEMGVEDSELMYQIHQFGESNDEMRVEWLRFVRPERKFASLDELKAQIARDIACL